MDELTDNLIAAGTLRTPRIIDAFRAVDRARFVLPEYRDAAYEDYPLPIGYEQTISQPTTVAFMLELLAPKPSDHVLDVGSGSGWTTALLAHIVGAKGKVIGVERIPEFVTFGRNNLAQYQFGNAEIIHWGRALGCAERASYDHILVSATSDTLPQELLAQLKEGGTIVIPVGDAVWHIVKKEGGEQDITRYPGFSFVPLIRP